MDGASSELGSEVYSNKGRQVKQNLSRIKTKESKTKQIQPYSTGKMSSLTPPATTASATPSPLAIGRTFLKQFYHVLTTSPDMIYKFYNPSSVLSHGEGSKPTTPTTMESLKDPKDLKDRFFSWAANPEDPVRFELENGAIDAQESINGGVLLVVTGHMYLGEDNRRPFCHTFFLHPFSPPNSTKRSYYVHNDVLRFLQVGDGTPLLSDAGAVETTADQQPVEPAEDEEIQAEAAPVEGEKKDEEEPTVKQTEEQEVPEHKPELEHAADQEEPVEESKGEPIDEEAVEETKEEVVFVEDIKEDSNKQRKTKGKKNGKAEQPPSSPKPPAGSWASLVASSADKPAPPAPPKKTAPAPFKKAAPPPPPAPAIVPTTAITEPTDEPEDEDETPATEGSNRSTTDHTRRHRRDPDNTLVVKNVPDGAKEADIRTLFEPFATATSTKVVGITVSAHRGLAFVDYDSAAPVVAALESPDRPFSLNGRVLDMEQKTMDVQRRAARGGGGSGGGGAGGGGGRNAPPSTRNAGAENGVRGGREGRGGGGTRRGGGGRDGRGGSDRGGGRGGR